MTADVEAGYGETTDEIVSSVRAMIDTGIVGINIEDSVALSPVLTDEREFWPRYPVPTVALNDPKFDPLQMWRGPTWVNINYLLIEGLQRTGYVDLARELRRRTLDMLSAHDDIYEYYQPQTGEVPPKAASIFGWSAAVYIDLAIQRMKDEG